MTQFLKDRMSFISSDLYEDILKLNKSHTNPITKIVPCKTVFRYMVKRFKFQFLFKGLVI